MSAGRVDRPALTEAQRIDAVARGGDGVVVRAFRPNAERLDVIDARSGQVAFALELVHPTGLFKGELTRATLFPYRLRERAGAETFEFDDPYRFGEILGATDAWLIAEGNHLRLWEVLGAHPRTSDGVVGTTFAVWAPNARRVSVVGDFNQWDGRIHSMRFRAECGVWEIFIPGDLTGHPYKYEIAGPSGAL